MLFYVGLRDACSNFTPGVRVMEQWGQYPVRQQRRFDGTGRGHQLADSNKLFYFDVACNLIKLDTGISTNRCLMRTIVLAPLQLTSDIIVRNSRIGLELEGSLFDCHHIPKIIKLNHYQSK